MGAEPEFFGPPADRGELKQRYARALDLTARTGRALAESRAGSDRERLKKEIEELRLKCAWQEARIAHLEKPLIVRAFRRLWG